MVKTLNELIGKKIVRIRPISKREMELEGWYDVHSPTSVIELNDGTKIIPSRDVEGNDAGTLFGVDKQGKQFCIWTKKEITKSKKTLEKVW